MRKHGSRKYKVIVKMISCRSGPLGNYVACLFDIMRCQLMWHCSVLVVTEQQAQTSRPQSGRLASLRRAGLNTANIFFFWSEVRYMKIL